MFKRIAFIVLLFLLAGAYQTTLAEETTQTIAVDGMERTFHLHLPPDFDDSDSRPVIIGLHTAASSGKAMAALTGLESAADEQGFIAVFPNSSGFGWNDGRDNEFSLVSEADDLAYMEMLIDHLVENYNADPKKIYLTGWGSGGLMAYRLACDMPERFAGVAVMGALMWQEHLQNCTPASAAPVNMLVIHGKNDEFYRQRTYTHTSPFAESSVIIMGVEDTMKFWAARSGCTDFPEDFIYTQCENEVRVAYYGVEGASQNWPRVGNYELNQFGVDATQLIMDFFMGNEWAVEQPDFTGQARTYIVYVPTSYTPDEPTPLVMALHGRPDNGLGMAVISDMNSVAEKEGFIVVYPNGLDNQWNYVKDVPLFDPSPQDDFAFIRSLIADLSKDFNIDGERLYVTGFSNGGFMTNRLACEMPDQFAAFASVGGSIFSGIENVCPPSISVNMLIMHGTDDVSIPWNGLPDVVEGRPYFRAYPVNEVVAFWAMHNRCSNEQDVEELPESGNSPGTRVMIVRIPKCDTGKELTIYVIDGGGHNWPGVPGVISERIAGKVNMDIHASEVIWEFFSRHTRSEE